MIAGGASLAPRRWSCPALATEARSRPWWRSTARITAVQKNRNFMFSLGVSPGSSRFSPESVLIDQLLCLPDPLTPAKGFSCSRQTRSYLGATFCMTCIASCWWSVADVRVLEHRGDLVLARRDLVVAGLDRHAEPAERGLDVEHVGEDPLRDGPEVVVVELLALGGLGAEERAARRDQVGALVEVVLVDQEVLLLGADRRVDARRLVPEQLEGPQGRLAERLHGAQQRDLLVERLAGPRCERRRDRQVGAVGVLHDERGARRVPGGVAAGLEGGAHAAGREAGGVRLALDQLLAGELGEGGAVPDRHVEAVVLLGGGPGQGLEPVGEMGRALAEGPILHSQGHRVGEGRVQGFAPLDGRLQGAEDGLGKHLALCGGVEDEPAEVGVCRVGQVLGTHSGAVGAPLGAGDVQFTHRHVFAVVLLALRERPWVVGASRMGPRR